MRKRLLLLGVLLLSATLCGCAVSAQSALERVLATPLPDGGDALHSPSADARNTDSLLATLYFRYAAEPLLAAETRVLDVPRDMSGELALVRALLDGPGAGNPELKRLFPESVQAISATARGDILFVTLSSDLMEDAVPSNWADLPEWREEAPLRRKLAIASLVSTITETYPYTGVQIMLEQRSGAREDSRLPRSYFLTGGDGPSEPVARDETLLLTPRNTAHQAMAAWQRKDFEKLYAYTAIGSEAAGDARPSLKRLSASWIGAGTLVAFHVSGGTVSADGQRAVVCVSLTAQRSDASRRAVDTYPLPLVRENGLWKIGYQQMLHLMDVE